MATVSLRVLRDDASQIISIKTMADADITRMITALSAMMSKTPQQVVDYALTHALNQGIAMTTNHEQDAVSVPPIPFT